MKELYSTTMINEGGRSGTSYAEDQSLSLKIAPPGSKLDHVTNPEQLFAAGYSACFNSALDLIKRQKKLKHASTIQVTVKLMEQTTFDYVLAVNIEGHIEGVTLEEAQQLLELTHTVCPYSKATMGNIDVTIKAV
ncbi:Ohr family peroxiredoxin [Lysinibacillus fusiformis]|uniref:Ohr family peroxiredoxin n=1 Tax=Lysinibacillus fusiformis TaxID=28031 RepID=UPI000D345232|nr:MULTISPECIES: Ohr family peroxiredoxin [Lysinibacillus]MED4670170.1 Ohr family peroxiredoxin [Lysinibacillus fusiformis]QAS56258.1 organic hydroperoxide resistance protein [Lysinibacillus sphaericus]RDV36077.1 organic hydroperoxide resistance protein [Lysinibacillus fusiformis]GED65964.1 osmotically inducible protein OsmC [Lysinibacillus fusiformis]